MVVFMERLRGEGGRRGGGRYRAARLGLGLSYHLMGEVNKKI